MDMFNINNETVSLCLISHSSHLANISRVRVKIICIRVNTMRTCISNSLILISKFIHFHNYRYHCQSLIPFRDLFNTTVSCVYNKLGVLFVVGWNINGTTFRFGKHFYTFLPPLRMCPFLANTDRNTEDPIREPMGPV